MAKQFDPNKRYRFSKDKCLTDVGNAMAYKSNWMIRKMIDNADGKEVVKLTPLTGKIGDLFTSPDYCEELLSSTHQAVKQVCNELYREVKTMKTWEMLQMIAENPKLKFKVRSGYVVCMDKQNYNLIWERNGNPVTLNTLTINHDGWEVVKPEPEIVDFMTAVNSGKKIKPVDGGYGFADKDEWFKSFAFHNNSHALNLINGKWYIE